MDKKYYPLRPIQRLLVDTHFKKARSTMMNIGALLKMSSVVDVERLADAIQETLQAHDIFKCRLTIHPETQDICQTFDGEIEPVKIEKLSDEEFELIRKKLLKQPYKIIDKPLYHITIFETPTSKYLNIDFYHAIMDGASIAILFQNEINLRYNGRTMPLKFLSYADYVEKESQISPAELKAGHAYWRNLVAKFDRESNLPPVDVRTIKLWTKGEIRTKFQNISEEFFRKSRRSETIFFLAATMTLLSKVSGNKNIFTKLVHSGRDNANERRIMGLMFDSFPCNWDFSEDIAVADFLDRLEGKIQKQLAYKKSLDVVYNEGLVDDCPAFVFHKNIFNDHAMIGDTTATVIDMPPNEISAVQNSLDIKVFSKEDGMYELCFDYDAGRFSRNSMKHFVANLDKVLSLMQDEKIMLSKIFTSIRVS